MRSDNGSKPKRGRGRPLKFIADPVMLGRLAEIFCSIEEAAAVLGTTEQNLRFHMGIKPKLAEAWHEGGLRAKVKLRRQQWRHAQREDAGGVQMTIHMSKHYLDQKERILFDFGDAIRHLDQLTDSQLDELIRIQKETLAAIAARAANGIDPDNGGDPAATRH